MPLRAIRLPTDAFSSILYRRIAFPSTNVFFFSFWIAYYNYYTVTITYHSTFGDTASIIVWSYNSRTKYCSLSTDIAFFVFILTRFLHWSHRCREKPTRVVCFFFIFFSRNCAPQSSKYLTVSVLVTRCFFFFFFKRLKFSKNC